ncbi:MAG TPA: potassium transporter TrkG, partial [Desulfopila sp.]|nr:potassium transporter TrkG [Desulfopila sp.]
GGLGIVILCMAMLLQPGLTAKRLDIGESFEDDIIGGTRAIARTTLVIYSAMTTLGIIALMVTGVHWYDSILYSLTAISTGGFAPYSTSLAGLPNVVSQYAVIAIAIGGATSLLLFFQTYEQGWRKLFLDSQLQAFMATAAVVAAALTLVLWFQQELSLSETLHHGILNGLSALSTAGFSSTNVGGMSDDSKLILILAMAVGGCAGSTAGGIKIIRLLILFRLLYLLIQRAAAPSRAVLEARLNGRKLEVDEMLNAVSIFVLFNIITTLSWLVFLTAGHPPLDSLFEVVSALGTVGLSSGITSIDLPLYLKAVLCINMLLGRLEIVAWLVFFYPGTWVGKRKED